MAQSRVRDLNPDFASFWSGDEYFAYLKRLVRRERNCSSAFDRLNVNLFGICVHFLSLSIGRFRKPRAFLSLRLVSIKMENIFSFVRWLG